MQVEAVIWLHLAYDTALFARIAFNLFADMLNLKIILYFDDTLGYWWQWMQYELLIIPNVSLCKVAYSFI